LIDKLGKSQRTLTPPSTVVKNAPLEVRTQLELPTAHVMMAQVNRECSERSFFHREGIYWVSLCLTPRRADDVGRYSDYWNPSRFTHLGALVAFPPSRRLELRSEGGRHGSLICQVRQDAVDRWLPENFVWTERRLEASLNISSETIKSLMLRLNQELRRPGEATEILCEAIVTQLAIELARYFTSASDADEKGGLASWRQRLIEDRMKRRDIPFPTVTELAVLCKISTRQLSRAFRASRGSSISDYLAQSRIEAAKRRLCTKDSIRDIAAKLGFSSQSSFTAAFRRSTGTTPAEFRKRIGVQ